MEIFSSKKWSHRFAETIFLILAFCMLFHFVANDYAFGAETPKKGDWKLEFSGYMQFYSKFSTEETIFTIPKAQLTLEASNRKLKFLKFVIEYDFAKKTLKETFIKAELHKLFNIRAGNFWCLNSLAPDSSLFYLIKYARTLEFITEYDTGILVNGKIWILEYYLGMLNGTQNIEDDNKEKDIYGHIRLNPFKWVKLGATYQKGTQINGDRIKCSGNMRLKFDKPNLLFLSEYFYEKNENQMKKDGWYVLGAWKPLKRFQFVAQYDHVFDMEKRKDDKNELALGINYILKGFRFQFNYIFSDTDSRILARAQVSF
jgi:hypothetical protein